MLRHSHARSFAARFVRCQRRAGSHAYIKLFFLFFLALLNHVWFNAGHSSCISKANVLRSESSGHQRDNQYYILCFWPLYSFANNLWKQVRGIIEQLVDVFFFFLSYFSFDSRRSLGLGRVPTREERGGARLGSFSEKSNDVTNVYEINHFHP